jgi:hypothetical protein
VPRVRILFRSPTLFSACPQHTGSKEGSPYPVFCVVCLPAISAFQRHSTQYLLHYRSPFGFHLFLVCRVFRSPTPFSACSRQSTQECPVRLCPTHWVWRLRLMLPTPVRVAGGLPPCMYIARSWLFPVRQLRRFPNQIMHSSSGLHGDFGRGIAPVIYAWPVV